MPSKKIERTRRKKKKKRNLSETIELLRKRSAVITSENPKKTLRLNPNNGFSALGDFEK
jgi:hypothetical protein